MDVGVLFHPAGAQGQAEGALEGGAGHRFSGGGGPLTGVALGRKEERGMAMGFPLLAQVVEGLFRQGHVAIALPLAGPDVQEPASGINVTDLEAQPFAQAQATGINGDEGHAMIQQGHLGENGAHLDGRQDHREFEARVGADQFDFGGPGTAEGFFPKKFDGADGLSRSLAGDFLVAFEEDEVLAELFRGDVLGGLMKMLGKLADAVPVGLLGALADRQELEVIGEGF